MHYFPFYARSVAIPSIYKNFANIFLLVILSSTTIAFAQLFSQNLTNDY